MDGTVNWARRDDGRPAFAGAAAAVAAVASAAAAGVTFSTMRLLDTGDFDLEGTEVCIDLTGALETGLESELTGARGVGEGLETTLALAGLALAATFLAAVAAGLVATLAAGLATGLAAFAATLGEALAVGLAASLAACTGLTEVFATDLAAAAAGAFRLAVAALLSFPELVFTSGLLADVICAWSVGPALAPAPLVGVLGVTSPARECTGSAFEKPISCKIETII